MKLDKDELAVTYASSRKITGTPDYYKVPFGTVKIPLCRLIDQLPHRRAEAIEHIYRSGNKPGESAENALRSAIRSLEMEICRLEILRVANGNEKT